MKHTLILILLTLWVPGCHIEENGVEAEEEQNTIPISGGQPTVTTTTTTTTSVGGNRTITICEGSFGYAVSQYTCMSETDRVWLSQCEAGQCSLLRANVHYMLSEDLGTGNTVVVEAFDNHYFKGSPSAVLRITNFDASRAGTHEEDYLMVAPGEYYVRAYISNEDEPPAPYQYGNMEIVSDKPFGLYGALSDATRVVVAAGQAGNVNIYIDKLFKTPGQEEPTNAHIRVVVTIDPSYEVPHAQEVRIQLHAQEDFDFHPVYDFELPSESLMIAGKEGRAEFVSGQLEPGDYFVFVWLDISGNGFYDEGEPSQTYKLYNEIGRVHIEKDKTESIELNLE